MIVPLRARIIRIDILLHITSYCSVHKIGEGSHSSPPSLTRHCRSLPWPLASGATKPNTKPDSIPPHLSPPESAVEGLVFLTDKLVITGITHPVPATTAITALAEQRYSQPAKEMENRRNYTTKERRRPRIIVETRLSDTN